MDGISTVTESLYCFCCRLFASKDSQQSAFIKDGFRQWWKLNPKVKQYEEVILLILHLLKSGKK